jgi:hypothetical protein
MAFIDIFNFKKYFSKPSDSQVARYGHVNALYDALQTDSQPKFTVDTVTQVGSNGYPVTINSTAGIITMSGTLSPIGNNFTVNNSKVTLNSIILLTPVTGSPSDVAKEILVIPNTIDNGSFNIMAQLTTNGGFPTVAPISINFLVINP